MIKIIKNGTRKTFTCLECGCYFSYEEEDIIEGKNSNLTGYQPSIKIIFCPQCNNKIQLQAQK